MSRSWRTDENGLVRVRDDGGDEFTPTLRDPKQVAIVEHGIARFGELFRAVGGTYSVPWEWMIGHAYRESGFNPHALRHEPNGWTGVGLFQPTHPSVKGGLTDEQLYDPQTNATVAARHIANLMHRSECRVDGVPDFVRVSAAYNAGSCRPDASNRWNLHVTPGHIDAEVAAVNYTVLRGLEEVQREAANALDIGMAFAQQHAFDDPEPEANS